MPEQKDAYESLKRAVEAMREAKARVTHAEEAPEAVHYETTAQESSEQHREGHAAGASGPTAEQTTGTRTKAGAARSRRDRGGDGGMKKILGAGVAALILAALFALLLQSGFYTVQEGEYAYITQFGKIVRTVEEPGLHVRVPFIQDVHHLSAKLMLYDVSSSEVLTADKKAMIVDSYALWRVTDVRTFFRTVGSTSELQKRLDAAVYSNIKNIVGGLQQNEIISDQESSRDSLNDRVTASVAESMKPYGIEVGRVEIRRYDLPQDNMSAVFSRMISERNQIAASFKADGAYEAAKIRNSTDKEYAIILGEAKAQAEKIYGEAEEKYMNTLAELYGQKDQAAFYRFMLDLESLRGSLSGDKTVILGPKAPLSEILSPAN